MAFKNPDHPIDVDVTAQMMNDRIGFQYGAIIQSNSGTDVLQQVLDTRTEQSDTQVELGIDIRNLYQENATQSNVTALMDESYSLILPNKNSLEENEDGILVLQRDDSYLNQLKSLYSQDIYDQNTRQRFPARSLVGRFLSLSDFASAQQYWRSSSAVEPVSQDDIEYGVQGISNPGNVTVNTSFRANEVFVGEGYKTATTSDTILSQLRANITVNGTLGVRNIVVTQNIQSLSDARLKTNIVPLENTLSAVQCIQPVMYDWKHKDTKREIGLIAQNVQTVFPQLVEKVTETDKDEDFLTVNYMGFIPILLGSMKQQQEQIEMLQKEVKLLKKQIQLQ